MFQKLFNMKSKEYKDFLNLISIFNNLLEQKGKQTELNLIAMTEIELLNITQALGINLMKWKESPSFCKEIEVYVKESYEKKNNSGLPASTDFVRENEDFLTNLLKDYKIERETHNYEPSIELKEKIKNIKKILKSLNKLYNLKRRLKMRPATGLKHIFLEEEGYSKLIEDGYFSKEEIKKMVSKLNKIKKEIFEIIEEETVSPEFYKRERELFFHKGLIGDSFYEFIDTFYQFVYVESYFLSYEDNEYYGHTDIKSFKKLNDIEKENIKYEEE